MKKSSKTTTPEERRAQVKTLTDQIEAGVREIYTSENYKGWLDFCASFHNYSLGNQILIAKQFPEASQVKGCVQWKKEHSRYVKKGEKGIRILAPGSFKREVENADGEPEEVRGTYFFPVTVFDVSQTDGAPLPDICRRLEGTFDAIYSTGNALWRISPCPVQYSDMQDWGGVDGCFVPAQNKIFIKEGMSDLDIIHVTLHEIAHASMHADKEIRKTLRKEQKEVEAESVSYIVCKWLGIDTDQTSFEYVASWGSDDLKELKASLERIRSTACDIIDKLDKALPPQDLDEAQTA
jgi:antirestriction protein ArdC